MGDTANRIVDDLNSTTELWAAIQVGDQIQLEADLIEEGAVVLSSDRFYSVLAKIDKHEEAYFDAFVVQSNIADKLVNISPAFVSSYLVGSDEIRYS